MKKVNSLIVTLLLLIGCATTQKVNAQAFHFKPMMDVMNYKAAGQPISYYENLAKGMGLKQIYSKEDGRERYFVWGKQINYQVGHMTETYTATGDTPTALNVDITENGAGKYTPITITVVFPNKQAQNQFRKEGMQYGCVKNNDIEDTDIDVTWKNVSGIKYILAKGLTSWRYVYFYEKDGMHMCTFLF